MRLLKMMGKYIKLHTYEMLFMLVSTILALYMAYITMKIIDDAIHGKGFIKIITLSPYFSVRL
ncbi:hypothetical protein PIPA1_15190 [Pelosinus sp. IPA-1]|nr:hypothetical protein PIPA1_15190 [Pelosinus sp. IPA-1]